MTFGAETDKETAWRQLDIYQDAGGNFIDTADAYSDGLSESIIGEWIKTRPHDPNLIICTKARFGAPIGSHGASRRNLIKSVENSLKRLNIDAIDLFVVHGWDDKTEVLDTLSNLGDLVRSGKIINVGWSNVSAWQLQKIVQTADQNLLPKPVSLQPQYNLLERGIELEVLPCCLENNISVTPWSPLGGGWLTGKYSASERPEGATRLGENPQRGVEAYDLRNHEKTYQVLDALYEIAKRRECPISHIALAWLSSRPNVSSVILGARTVNQLSNNLNASNLTLEASEIDALNEVSALPALPYPYNFLRDWTDIKIWNQLGTSN